MNGGCPVEFPFFPSTSIYTSRYIYNFPGTLVNLLLAAPQKLWSVHNFFYRKLRIVWRSICMSHQQSIWGNQPELGKEWFQVTISGLWSMHHDAFACLVGGALWGRYAFHDHGAKKATERSHGPTTSKGLLLMTFCQIPCSKGGHPFQRHHRLTVKPLTHGPCYTLLFLCKESTSGHAIRPPA